MTRVFKRKRNQPTAAPSSKQRVPTRRSNRRRSSSAQFERDSIIRKRAKLGPLRHRRVSSRTMECYHQALVWLFGFFAAMNLVIPDDEVTFDEMVGDAIDVAWSTGEARALVGHFLSGLAHQVDSLRGKLRFSWSLWRAWGRLEPPIRAPPVTLLTVQAICERFTQRGLWDAALLTLLAFHVFLRTTEFTSLTVAQLVFSHDRTRLQVLFPDSKIAHRTGNLDTVHVQWAWLVKSLAKLARLLSPTQQLLSLSLLEYRLAFAEAVSFLGLDPDRFKPYSLRRGGASHHFRRHGKMDWTMELGRWSELRTARIYVHTANLELARMTELESPTIRGLARTFLTRAR